MICATEKIPKYHEVGSAPLIDRQAQNICFNEAQKGHYQAVDVTSSCLPLQLKGTR